MSAEEDHMRSDAFEEDSSRNTHGPSTDNAADVECIVEPTAEAVVCSAEQSAVADVEPTGSSGVQSSSCNQDVDDIPEEFECVVCMKLLLNPVSTPCGHTFCQSCIETSLGYKSRCPLCRSVVPDGAQPNLLLISIIEQQFSKQIAVRKLEEAQAIKQAEADRRADRQSDAASASVCLPLVYAAPYISTPLFPGASIDLVVRNETLPRLANAVAQGNRKFGFVYDVELPSATNASSLTSWGSCVAVEEIRVLRSPQQVYRITLKTLFRFEVALSPEEQQRRQPAANRHSSNLRSRRTAQHRQQHPQHDSSSSSAERDATVHEAYRDANSDSGTHPADADDEQDVTTTIGADFIARVTPVFDKWVTAVDDDDSVPAPTTSDNATTGVSTETLRNSDRGQVVFENCVGLCTEARAILDRHLRMAGTNGRRIFADKYGEPKTVNHSSTPLDLEEFSMWLCCVINAPTKDRLVWFGITDTAVRLARTLAHMRNFSAAGGLLSLGSTSGDPGSLSFLMLAGPRASIFVFVFFILITAWSAYQTRIISYQHFHFGSSSSSGGGGGGGGSAVLGGGRRGPTTGAPPAYYGAQGGPHY